MALFDLKYRHTEASHAEAQKKEKGNFKILSFVQSEANLTSNEIEGKYLEREINFNRFVEVPLYISTVSSIRLVSLGFFSLVPFISHLK